MQNTVPGFIPEWWTLVDVIRTEFRQDVVTLYSMVHPDVKEWLERVIEGCAGDKAASPKIAA